MIALDNAISQQYLSHSPSYYVFKQLPTSTHPSIPMNNLELKKTGHDVSFTVVLKSGGAQLIIKLNSVKVKHNLEQIQVS
ncbi:unnamed protein product [Heterobilharzia americana]|nr:unnamed protein product [Heterobilharzia americana]